MKQQHADAKHHANREQTAQQGVPEGWNITTLSEVVRPSNKKIKPSTTPHSRYLSLEHIEQDSGRILGYGTAGYVRSTKAVFCAGDVLYGKLRPYLNKVCTPDFDGVCSTDILVFPRSALVESGYLFRFLMRQLTVEYAHHHSSGVQLPRVSFEELGQIRFPLPPLAEQRRIVARMEALLGRVQAARARLAKVPTLLKRFRQSVLAAACSGELTKDWRESLACLGSALDEVERLRGVRPTPTEMQSEFPVKRWRLRDVRPNGASDLPEIPVNWTWLYLPDVGYMNRGRSRHRPRNAPHLYGGSHPFIQTGDIARSGGRISDHRQTYSDEGLAQSRLWPKGAICVTIAANIADSAILTYPACFPDSVVGLLPDLDLCLAEYVEFFIRTARQDLSQFAPATAQKNINISILEQVALPLPPLLEQHEIVRRVEALFALADKIESRVALATQRVEKTTQAILAKAFRGELVPTEAELARQQNRDYEPATALLERIRAQRARLAEMSNAKRKRSAKRS